MTTALVERASAILGLALCMAVVPAQASPQEARRFLSEAQNARMKGIVADERRLLESALGANPEPDQIARAEMRLAFLAWRIGRNYESAAQHLDRAEATGSRLQLKKRAPSLCRPN